MSERRRYDHVLAIYPNTRGFGFVLLEAPLAPLDWAAVVVPGKNRNRECVRRITALFGRCAPDVLILQDMDPARSSARRACRVYDLNEAIAVFAETQGVPVVRYSREHTKEMFTQFGAPTKQRIAETIAKSIPAFERYVPRIRKPWMSEDARMGLFDAAALAITYFRDVDNRLKM